MSQARQAAEVARSCEIIVEKYSSSVTVTRKCRRLGSSVLRRDETTIKSYEDLCECSSDYMATFCGIDDLKMINTSSMSSSANSAGCYRPTCRGLIYLQHGSYKVLHMITITANNIIPVKPYMKGAIQ